MRRSLWVGVMLAMCSVLPVFGQATPLESFFTGKQVVLKIDMPGTQMGVDLQFNKASAMDWNEYSNRIKTYGIAIHKGDSVMITKFVEKKDRIEFQLAGGGFGTIGDDSNTNVSARYVPKSDYEKDLEKKLANTNDPYVRRNLQRELDKERARRERIDAKNQAAASVASQMKSQIVADKRLQGGSRFNLRWKGQIPSDARNPDAIMQLLSAYVDFGADADNGGGPSPMGMAPGDNSGGSPVGQLQRGMKIDDVANLLGQGMIKSHSTTSDGLMMVVMEYKTPDSRIDVTYVEGVVVRYSINSN